MMRATSATVLLLSAAVLLLLSLATSAIAASSGDVILVPPANSSGSARRVGLIYIQGESIGASQYAPVALAIQTAAAQQAGIALYVGIPEAIDSLPNPITIGGDIERVMGKLAAAGLPADATIFAAAHSVGGVFLQTYVLGTLDSYEQGYVGSRHPRGAPLVTAAFRQQFAAEQQRLRRRRVAAGGGKVNFAGFILMGSFVQRINNASWNFPTMTIGGEVDGLCRITRIVQAYQLQTLSHNASTSQFPTGIIDGAAHMSFASGAPSAFVTDFDLKPFASDRVVHAQIGSLAADFFTVNMPDDAPRRSRAVATSASAAADRLATFVHDSARKYFDALVEAFELEGVFSMKPACYCNNSFLPPDYKDPFFGGYINVWPCNATRFPGTYVPGTCRTGSAWGARMQARMAVIDIPGGTAPPTSDATVYDTTSGFHAVEQTKPDSNLPFVFNNCSDVSRCKLTITVVNNNIYTKLGFDTGLFPEAAEQIEAKMLSRQRMWEAATTGTKYHWNLTDGWDLNVCAALNKEAMTWALARAAPHSVARYNSIGQRAVFGADVNSPGPLWIDSPLWQTTAGDTLVIASPAMSIPYPYFIEQIQGFHYCKLYSPAAALEWLLLDSLRQKDALKN